MIDKMTKSSYLSTLEQAINAANLRHKAISNNIANVNTPGFKKSVVEFESLLAESLAAPVEDENERRLPLFKTHKNHLPNEKDKEPVDLSPRLVTVDTTTMRTDGNNVDIDQEMAELAKNSIYYNANLRQLNGYLSTLKSALSGQR